MGISYDTDNQTNHSVLPYDPNSAENTAIARQLDSFKNTANNSKAYDTNDLFEHNDFKTYATGPNSNAWDTSFLTREPRRPANFAARVTQNGYMPKIERLYGFVYSQNPVFTELRKRSISYNYGTAIMFAKVKPKDQNDENYYFLTNQHVGFDGSGMGTIR